MPINLKHPIDLDQPAWQAAYRLLQGNIVKGHGRDHVALVPFSLIKGPEGRSRLGAFGSNWVTSAAHQLDQTQSHKGLGDQTPAPRPDLFCGLYISVWGYDKLGYGLRELQHGFVHPFDQDNPNWFLDGMQHAGRFILDPPRIAQQPEYRDNIIDGLLLLASDEQGSLQKALVSALSEMQGWAQPIVVEIGKVLRRDGYPIEPFGFRDGISRPDHFDGKSPDYLEPRRILVRDPFAGHPDAYGSYLVYRKLEQNVRAFHDAETAIAAKLNLSGPDRARAGAMLIGRFRDGTPLTLQSTPGNPTNEFNHEADDGSRCPMHAHIRKVRPRAGDSYKRAQIVRRGVPYGPYDPTAGDDPPEVGTGLLFMSFQADLHDQFGLLMRDWVNAIHYPELYTGQDPLLGHGSHPYPADQKWPTVWGEEDHMKLQCGASPKLVTLKGGEFLFAPSLAWFASI
jgi:Dyp-type peroxidase family